MRPLLALSLALALHLGAAPAPAAPRPRAEAGLVVLEARTLEGVPAEALGQIRSAAARAGLGAVADAPAGARRQVGHVIGITVALAAPGGYRLDVLVRGVAPGPPLLRSERRCAPCSLDDLTQLLYALAAEAAALIRPPPPPAPPPLRWRLALGAPLLAVGLGGLLPLGAYSLSEDGRCADPLSPCENRYQTRLSGGVLIGAGAALALAGAALLVADRIAARRAGGPAARRRGPVVAPVAGSGMAGAALAVPLP
jgi:hypothetical protein